MKTGLALSIVLSAAATGCAGTHESAVRDALRDRPVRVTRSSDSTKADVMPPDVSGLSDYVAFAMEHSPALQAEYAHFEASVRRISRARRLPEPTLGFGYFVRAVETRVGPQKARLSLQQTFPWPTKLSAGADAASAEARASERRLKASSLNIIQRVAAGYWNLWQVRATRDIHRTHLAVLQGLSESARARLSTGATSLAELQQIDLAAARLEDNLRGMDEEERALQARLAAAVGLHGNAALPTPQGPGVAALPNRSEEELIALTRSHPAIASLGLMAEASEASARAESADRLPSFTVGADWIITGEARMPDVSESGKDAVVVGAGLRIPLWQGSYDDGVAASEATARARRLEQETMLDATEAEVTAVLAQLRDAARRMQLYEVTLVPQAESAYESVLGAYAVGHGTVAQALLAQRDLLELRIELTRARADHARSWVRLEELVAHELSAAPAAAPNAPGGPHES